MTPQEALQIVLKKIPFEGYIQSEEAHLNIANTVLTYLRPGDRILDFGSGPCDKTAVLSLLGFRCSAYDDLQDDWHKIEGNRDKIISFAKEFDIDFKLANGEELSYEKDTFDMLMMTDVLEHLHDSPRNLLNDLLQLVKKEGYLFATVPNAVNIRKRIAVLFGKTNLPSFEIYYWYPGPWRGHIREYTKDDLTKLAEYLTLDIVELRSCHHGLRRLPSFARPIYRALTSVFTGWRDTWLLVAKKKPGWAPRKSIPPDELTTILDHATPYQY